MILKGSGSTSGCTPPAGSPGAFAPPTLAVWTAALQPWTAALRAVPASPLPTASGRLPTLPLPPTLSERPSTFPPGQQGRGEPASERACARKRRGGRRPHGGPGGAAPRVGGVARPPLAGDCGCTQAGTEYRERSTGRKAAPVLVGRDNFGWLKDNFGWLRDKNPLLFVSRWYNQCLSKVVKPSTFVS